MKYRNFKKIFFISVLLLVAFCFAIFNVFIPVTALVVEMGNSSQQDDELFQNDIQDDTEPVLELKFFPLGNDISDNYIDGDSCIITYGDIQILIDAGANSASRNIINKRLEEVLRIMQKKGDSVWEYVIVTHRDEDHIGALFHSNDQSHDTGYSKFVFNYITEEYLPSGVSTRVVENFIDFDSITYEGFEDVKLKQMWKEKGESNDPKITPITVKNYFKKRDVHIQTGKIRNYYSALEFYKEIQKVEIDSDLTLEILYNYYYDHIYNSDGSEETPSRMLTNADVNNQSVCFLLTHNNKKFLFTGDLEEYDSAKDYSDIYGESKLLEYNKGLKDGVDFYKAAHHGSNTSNSVTFIDAIKPEYVVVTSCAGGKKHDFPKQKPLNHFLKYTDKIYITAKYDAATEKTLAYYGEILVRSNGEEITVKTSNETIDGMETPKPITQTDWMIQNRTTSLSTYIFDLDNVEANVEARCTLIKYGSIDVLIDCGVGQPYTTSNIYTNTMHLVKKVQEYCIDGVLDYVIVTHAQVDAISHFIGSYKNGENQGDGIFGKFKIGTLIDFGSNSNLSSSENKQGWLARYRKIRNEKIESGDIACYNPMEGGRRVTEFNITDNDFKLSLFNTQAGYRVDENSYAICSLIYFYGAKILYTGDFVADEKLEKTFLDEAGDKIENVDFLIDNGMTRWNPSSTLEKTINAKYTIINTTLQSNSFYSSYRNLCKIDKKQRIRRIYPLATIVDGEKEAINGSVRCVMTRGVNNLVDNKEGLDIVSLNNNSVCFLEDTNWFQLQGRVKVSILG